MRTRTVASEKDSGLAKAERSASSAQGRRWERPLRTVSVMWLRKARKAGVAIGGWAWDSTDPAAATVVEIGRTGGTVVDIVAGSRSEIFLFDFCEGLRDLSAFWVYKRNV